MKDKRSGDARRNGNDAAPQPIRKNAKAKERYAGPQGDLDKHQSHRLTLGTIPMASLLRLPRTRSASSANGPKIKAILSQARVDLPRSRAMSYTAGIEAIETS